MTDWSRLAKLAGMLGSPHDGERLNAARLLEAALTREGVSFGDLSKRIAEGGSGYSAPRIVYVDREVVKREVVRSKPNPAADLARKILVRTEGGKHLDYQERRFLRSILANDDYTGGQFSLSTPQANWLTMLSERHLKPKMKRYTTAKAKPVPDSLLDALGLNEASEEKENTDDFVGAFRQRAAGERVQPKEKVRPDVRSGGQAPGAEYKGDFKRDPVDDFDSADEPPF